MRFGQRDEKALCENLCASFFFIALVTVFLNILSFACLDGLRTFLRVPAEVWGDMREYLFVIFMGIPAVFLYNYFASFLRAIGNSVIPLGFLAVSAVLNIALDLWFVIGLNRGVAGAAEATVIAQYVSGIGIAVFTLARFPQVRSIWKAPLPAARTYSRDCLLLHADLRAAIGHEPWYPLWCRDWSTASAPL